MKFKHLITGLLDLGAGLYDPFFRLMVDEQELRKRLLDLAHLEGSERALDIACGTGSLGVTVAKALNKGSVCGIDISSKMVEVARKKAAEHGHKIDYRVGNSTGLPYENSEFDVVFTSLLYHHLDYVEKRRTLSEIHRVLKGDGRYVSVEFGEFPKDLLHRMIVSLTRSSGILHGMHPDDLIQKEGFNRIKEMEGPTLAGHHRTKYRILTRK